MLTIGGLVPQPQIATVPFASGLTAVRLTDSARALAGMPRCPARTSSYVVFGARVLPPVPQLISRRYLSRVSMTRVGVTGTIVPDPPLENEPSTSTRRSSAA